jgi:acetyltransferase-like isoleucine patch superfamily enzyme
MRSINQHIIKVLIRSYYFIYTRFVYFATAIRWLPGLNIPGTSLVYWRCRYLSPENIIIGNNTIICQDVWLDGRGGIQIGNNVVIGTECRLYTMKHSVDNYPEVAGAPIIIGNWVWVGNQVTILEGVTIGDGAVIASGSVVTHNVDSWTLSGGVPAKFIRDRSRIKYTLDTSKIEKLP